MSAAATQIYGTSRMPSKAIFENLLNNRDIVVRDKITDIDGRALRNQQKRNRLSAGKGSADERELRREEYYFCHWYARIHTLPTLKY